MIKQNTDFENPLVLQAQKIIQAQEENKKELEVKKSSAFYGLCKQFIAASVFAIGTYVLRNALSWTFKLIKEQIFGSGEGKEKE